MLLIDLLKKLTVEDSYNGTESEKYDAVNFAHALIADLYTVEFGDVGMPIGSVVAYALDGAPDDSLLCDGTEYHRVTYPELYAVINGNFRVDEDHFVVPDLRDAFVMGVSATRNPGDTGGEEEHTLTIAEMPAHTHEVIYQYPVSAPGSTRNQVWDSGPYSTPTKSTGGGDPHENLPPYVVLAYFIKYV